MSGHDSKSFITVFFCTAQSSKWWLLFETWLPFRQSQWKVLSPVFISLYSFSTIPSSSSARLSLPHSERFGHSESTFFNRQNQRRNSPLVETRSVELDWCPQDEAIHARKMTPIFIQANKNFTSGHHTHTNTCMSLYLHLGASKPFKWTLYSRYNNCSCLWFDRKIGR